MTEILKRPPDSEMCPPGFHVVHGFKRKCKSGISTWVDAHIRRNRGKSKSGLLIENIYFLYWQRKKSYSQLQPIFGFGNKGIEFDSVIQFWIEYWSSEGIEYPAGLDPLLIKALIAVESSFDPKKKNPRSTASGLMQITDQSLRVISGFPGKDDWVEIKKNLVLVEKSDRFDPIVNIALGTRLLGYKYSKIKNNAEKNIKTMVAHFNSKGEEGVQYAKKVFDLYEKSKKP